MATTTATASWGVSTNSTVQSVTGVVTDIEIGEDSVLAPEYNEVGQVIKQTHYDTKKTMTVTVEVASGTSKPAAGASITIGGVSGYVVSSKVVESNQAYRKIHITAECYTNCTSATAVATTGGSGSST